MYKLILLRHGQSEWNQQNNFTGWTDVGLTAQGEQEARQAGRAIKEANLVVKKAYTSVLKRAIKTLWLALEELEQEWIPVEKDWRLNEKHYGELQGKNKKQTAQEEGEEQVFAWRRSYDTPPPPLKESDARHPSHDPRYQGINPPSTECLKDVVQRLTPYYQQTIKPELQAGQAVLIAAHGNSLRALVKHLDGVSEEDITQINIPTGIPLIYELDKDYKPLKSYYLADEQKVKELQRQVANQAK